MTTTFFNDLTPARGCSLSRDGCADLRRVRKRVRWWLPLVAFGPFVAPMVTPMYAPHVAAWLSHIFGG